MLQEDIPASHLRRADELATLREDLAADGHRKTRSRTVGRPDRSTVWGERGVNA
jgi:hypothetical protein